MATLVGTMIKFFHPRCGHKQLRGKLLALLVFVYWLATSSPIAAVEHNPVKEIFGPHDEYFVYAVVGWLLVEQVSDIKHSIRTLWDKKVDKDECDLLMNKKRPARRKG